MDENEFAWRLYESERDFIKHHENQRTNASSILAAISTALVVAIASGISDDWLRLLVAVTMVLVGVFGAIFSGKLYELIQLHASRSYEYLEIANASFPTIDVTSIKGKVKKSQEKRYPFFASISLNKIWFRFHILVALFGLVVCAIIILDMKGYKLPGR